MKTNCWLILGTMLATTAVAQVNTNKLPEIPAPASTLSAPAATMEATNAPAPKKKAPAKKKAVKKISEPSVTLVAGPATVISENLNMRGQAGVKGEVVGHLKAGEAVTVISQINLDKHAADEPAQWAKITLPAGNKVWVSSKFVDAATKTVSAKKLNLRAGPGENYSVLGVLEKGATVNELSAKGDWMQIETPASAFAFVAAMYLHQEPPMVAPATVITATETPVATTPATASTVPEAAPLVTQPATDTNVPAAMVDTNLPPPPPRVVSHEGYVRSSSSLIAPTPFELYDPESGNSINYLYSTTTNLNLSRYNGYKIIATGEEGMSARWAATPVLTIQKVYLVSTNPPIEFQRVASPRGAQQQIIRASKPQQRR